jgi:predicted nucleotidyltransferase
VNEVRLDPELVQAMRRAVRAEVERQLADEDRRANELRESVMSRLPATLARLRERGLLERAWIFGSYAWGTPTEQSDLDLLIESDRDALEIATLVSAELRIDVHAIDRRRAPQSLVARVDGEGIVV